MDVWPNIDATVSKNPGHLSMPGRTQSRADRPGPSPPIGRRAWPEPASGAAAAWRVSPTLHSVERSAIDRSYLPGRVSDRHGGSRLSQNGFQETPPGAPPRPRSASAVDFYSPPRAECYWPRTITMILSLTFGVRRCQGTRPLAQSQIRAGSMQTGGRGADATAMRHNDLRNLGRGCNSRRLH